MAEQRVGPEPDSEDDVGFAKIDLGRLVRRGYPEAIFAEVKTEQQLAEIAAAYRRNDMPALFTRVRPDQASAILNALPDAAHHSDARLIAWPALPPEPTGGSVVVASAGTSDLPVAREAQLTARHLGRAVDLVTDIGVAGLHRTLRRLDQLRRADCLIVVAGMDGALPSVLAGLVACPVVAVPTSVGYGATFGGVAALLGMLTSCSPGIAVVNIDNGYGAGYFAASVTADR